MKDKLISVIVPVFKVEKYLKKCVDSIINQTYKNLEIILVDDGSPDGSPQMCDEYMNIDSRIKVIHKKNGGLSSARNAGLRVANGEYIGFVDSDDYIAPNMYEKLFNCIIETHSDLVIGNYKFVDEAGLPIQQQTESPIKDELLTGYEALEKLNEDGWWYFITAWNKIYRKSIFDEIKFPEGKLHEDVFVAHEIFTRCEKIVTMQEILYLYVQRQGSIMSGVKSIKHLDEAEAFSNRCFFYEKNNLNELIPGSLNILYRSYNLYRSNVNIDNTMDKSRLKEIDKLFRKTYFKFSNQVSIKDYIKYLNPDIYFVYIRFMHKFHSLTNE